MSLAAPHARVVRDGVIRDIPAEEVVPGDLIVLEAGNRVPADAVLLEANNLYSDESMLTGESIPVAKIRTDQTNASLTGVTSRNMVYMGSMITNGTGRALVMVTGMETEMGKIAEMMETAGVQDTLQKSSRSLESIWLPDAWLSVPLWRYWAF